MSPLSLSLQSRTPALIFEYVDNTDFKVKIIKWQTLAQLHMATFSALLIYAVQSGLM